jgi:hypothetical protein
VVPGDAVEVQAERDAVSSERLGVARMVNRVVRRQHVTDHGAAVDGSMGRPPRVGLFQEIAKLATLPPGSVWSERPVDLAALPTMVG